MCIAWYQTCTEALQRFQREAVDNAETERLRQAEKEQCLKELETELKDINDANVGSGIAGFLRHLYDKYPPKNAKHILDSEGLNDERHTKKIKTILLKAIQHYHPDKQDKEKDGPKWVVLCGEIAKVLNSRYEAYKFPTE